MTEPAPDPSTASRSRRLDARSATFAGLLLGGLLAIVASAQPWWRAAGGGAQVTFKGTEASVGLSQALAVVTLAGTLLVLVVRVRGRRVVAVLLMATGVATVLVGALRARPGSDAVRTKMRTVSLVDTYTLAATPWPYVFALAGLLVLAGAALLWLSAPHWPTRPDRFERTGPQPALAEVDDPARVWKALDAGLDPTVADDRADTPT